MKREDEGRKAASRSRLVGKVKATCRRKIDGKIIMQDDKNKSCKRTIKQVISHMSVTGGQVLEKERQYK